MAGLNMALRISFKPGKEQSQCAARYFHDTVGGLVDAMIDGLQERSYRIRSEQGPSLRLRVWSSTELGQEGLHELFEWLLALRADIFALQEEPSSPDHVAPLVANWLSPHLGGAQLFVELSIVRTPDLDEERLEFALGMVRGRCVMISTDTLLFTWLEEGVFGLTLAGHGSYLMEMVDGGEGATRRMRRAS